MNYRLFSNINNITLITLIIICININFNINYILIKY